VKFLLDCQVDIEMDIDEKDKHGQTPLFYAVMRRHQETAKILLDAGANPNIKCGKRGIPAYALRFALAILSLPNSY
jgi:ankyrin repeat protein